MFRRCLFVAALAVVVCGLAAPAGATSLLDGKVLQVDYLYPDINSVYSTSHFSVTVGAGVEVADVLPLDPVNLSIDLSDTNILFTFTNSSFFNNYTSFSGVHIWDKNGTVAPMVVTAIDATHLSGFAPSRVTYDDNNIWVYFGGVSFLRGNSLSLEVAAADPPANSPAIPEPASLLLLGTGLVGAARAWRQRRA